MLRHIKMFMADERGQASTEYGIIIGVIAIGIIVAAIAFKDKIVELFDRAGSDLDTVNPN